MRSGRGVGRTNKLLVTENGPDSVDGGVNRGRK